MRVVEIVTDRAPAGVLPVLEKTDYLGYFVNEHGEQLIFVQKKGAAEASLLHSDFGPKPVAVVGGVGVGIILSAAEQAWLSACWDQSKWTRA